MTLVRHAPRVQAVTWVVYKNRSSRKLYWTSWEARKINIAHAGRSQHRSCAKNPKKYVGKPNCKTLKRKPLAPSANSRKRATFLPYARTRSWDVCEEKFMPNPARARDSR